MNANRLTDYLEHMFQATQQACGYVETMNRAEFLVDKRTQQAVIFNLQIIGEAASKLLQDHTEFLAQYPDVPWRNMQGMRNRMLMVTSTSISMWYGIHCKVLYRRY